MLLLLLATLAGAQTPPARGEAERVVRGPGIAIHHPPGRRQRAIDFLSAFLELKRRVVDRTGVARLPDIRLDLFEDVAAMNRSLHRRTSLTVPPWTAGAAVARLDWIVIRLDAPGLESERLHGLLAHEVAHIAVGTANRRAGRPVVPRWLTEGIAQLVEGRVFTRETADLRPRAFLGSLIPLDELEASFPASEGGSALAYTQAFAFTRFLELQYAGPDFIAAILEELAEGVPLDEALEGMFRRSPARLEAEWIESLESDRTWILGLAGQVLFGFLILFAVVLGASRFVQRRHTLEERWEREERLAEGPATGRRFRPPLRPLGRDETPPPV